MNQFFLNQEKVKELRIEGQRSQGSYRSGAARVGLRTVPKLIVVLLGLVSLLIR